MSKAGTAVAYYEREVESAREAVYGTDQKVEKYEALLAGARSDRDHALVELEKSEGRLAVAKEALEVERYGPFITTALAAAYDASVRIQNDVDE